MAKKKALQPGVGKLLDAWVPPDEAGDAIGCIATSFTFNAAFFEEECLGSFIGLETNPTDDGPAYLIEREDKLAKLACAAVLVDAHHCRGTRSLRWDLMPARLQGIQHAKVTLLVWAGCVGNDEETAALAAYQSAVEQTQALNRKTVRQRATEIFDTTHVVDPIIEELANLRTSITSGAVAGGNSKQGNGVL